MRFLRQLSYKKLKKIKGGVTTKRKLLTIGSIRQIFIKKGKNEYKREEKAANSKSAHR
jgi:hypothetical protein